MLIYAQFVFPIIALATCYVVQKLDYFTEKWLGIGIVSNVFIDLAFE